MSVEKIVIRSCLFYEFKLGTNVIHAVKRICSAFGEGAVNVRTAQKWCRTFESGDTTLNEEPRSGRPSVIGDSILVTTLQNDTSQTCEELSKKLNVGAETIRCHLHHLGKKWKKSQWVPSELTAATRLNRNARPPIAKKYV